eukprot:Gb_07419 [translate_table: standard]
MSSAHHQYSVSDGIVSYFSSPSDSFHAPYWSPMAQGEFASATMPESRSDSLSFPSYKEGCLGTGMPTGPYSVESTSSHSDIGDHEQRAMIHFPPPHRNFSGRYSFMSKPVYPMPFPAQATETEGHGANPMSSSNRLTSTQCRNSFRWPDNSVHHEPKCFGGFSEFGSMQAFPEHGTAAQRERFGWISVSSPDFGWDRESPVQAVMTDVDPKYIFGSASSSSEGFKCGLCERWLSQKSPWSSHRMIRCGDFPASGVLSCGHVYHADCLEQTIPESQKHDPPCPSCAGAPNTPLSNIEQSASVSRQQLISSSGGKFPRFGITKDKSPSTSGNHNYVHSDYVTDVSGKKWHMQMPGCSRKSFLSKTLSRRNFFRGKSIKEQPAVELPSKNAGSPRHVYHENKSTDHLRIGCSRG